MKLHQYYSGGVMNIRFEYEYRDAGNYKNCDEIVFANKNDLSVDTLNEEIQQALISKEFFVAEDVGIPPLYFDKYNPVLDHGWHYFRVLSETTDKPTDPENRDISDLITAFQAVVWE